MRAANSPKAWLGGLGALAAAALVLGVGVIVARRESPRCTADLIDTAAAVERSRTAFQGASGQGEAECVAYRTYVAALEKAQPVAAICGPLQKTKASAYPDASAELAFHRRLLAELCP